MTYTLDEHQLSEMLTTAARMGAQQLAVDHGLIKTKISRSEAYRRYTKRLVDRWINEGKIKPVKNGGRTMIDVKQLEKVSSTNELWHKVVKPVQHR